MFLSPGYAAAIPVSAGVVVGIALEVRNVITAENHTKLVRGITANLTMRLSSSNRPTLLRNKQQWRFYFPPGARARPLSLAVADVVLVRLGRPQQAGELSQDSRSAAIRE